MKVRHLPAICLAATLVFAAAPGAAAQDADDPIVGGVGDTEIRQSEIIATYDSLPADYQQVPVERLHRILLDRAIDDALIAQRAAKLGFEDDVEVKLKLRLARAQVMRETYFTRQIDAAVTEDAVKARYDEKVAEMPAEEEVRARHILVKSEDEAKAVIESLGEADADFAKVAGEKSIGPSAAQGGDLGYFTKAAMVPEFAEAAFAMAVGEVSTAPVQSQFGWHVIKVEDRREAAAPDLEEMRADIFNELAQETIAEGIDELRDGAVIERFEFDGSEVAPPEEPAEPAKAE
jgi:peptidyl-prolyl cis-trans isomerase C